VIVGWVAEAVTHFCTVCSYCSTLINNNFVDFDGDIPNLCLDQSGDRTLAKEVTRFGIEFLRP
jgi:hypothetical protein